MVFGWVGVDVRIVPISVPLPLGRAAQSTALHG